MKKISLFLLALVLCGSLTACASRTPFDTESFSAAAKELTLTVTDVDAATLGQPGVEKVTVASDENQTMAAEVILFTDEASAKALYATMISSLAGGTVEKKVDSSPYNKLYTQNGTTFCAVIRVGKTLFFGQDESSGQVKELLKKLGAES